MMATLAWSVYEEVGIILVHIRIYALSWMLGSESNKPLGPVTEPKSDFVFK